MYGAAEKTLANDVIDQNPLEWQTYSNKSRPCQYILMNWKEITKEEYKAYENEND